MHNYSCPYSLSHLGTKYLYLLPKSFHFLWPNKSTIAMLSVNLNKTSTVKTRYIITK